MSASTRKWASFTGWAAVAGIAVIYSPMAIEYMWRFFNPDAPGLWNHAFSAVVDHDEVYGAGSVHAEQAAHYTANRTTLLFHTTAGGLAIILFAAQFSARFRRNLARHRIVGRVAVSIALVGMFGALVFLLAMGPDGIFDGPAFYLQLWALALGTAAATALGFVAAVRRQIAMHQALMAYAFALLLTAPLLRVFYLVLGNVWPDTTQLETNLAGAAVLSTWAPFGAFLAVRSQDHRTRRNAAIAPLPGRRLDATLLVVAAISAALLAWRFADVFDGLDRVTTLGLIGTAAALAIATANVRRARTSGADLAAEEWRLISLGLLGTAPAGVVLWLVYDVPFSTVDAWFGALLTAAAVGVTIAFAVLVWRRRKIRSVVSDREERTALAG